MELCMCLRVLGCHLHKAKIKMIRGGDSGFCRGKRIKTLQRTMPFSVSGQPRCQTFCFSFPMLRFTKKLSELQPNRIGFFLHFHTLSLMGQYERVLHCTGSIFQEPNCITVVGDVRDHRQPPSELLTNFSYPVWWGSVENRERQDAQGLSNQNARRKKSVGFHIGLGIR